MVEPKDTPEIPDPPDRFWNPMDIAGNYEEPFAPASKKAATCICVCCGATQAADYDIRQYPFRHLPTGFEVPCPRTAR